MLGGWGRLCGAAHPNHPRYQLSGFRVVYPPTPYQGGALCLNLLFLLLLSCCCCSEVVIVDNVVLLQLVHSMLCSKTKCILILRTVMSTCSRVVALASFFGKRWRAALRVLIFETIHVLVANMLCRGNTGDDSVVA